MRSRRIMYGGRRGDRSRLTPASSKTCSVLKDGKQGTHRFSATRTTWRAEGSAFFGGLVRAELSWIEAPWQGRLAISPRPRGGDWLEDEVREWRLAGVEAVVSLLTSDEITD